MSQLRFDLLTVAALMAMSAILALALPREMKPGRIFCNELGGVSVENISVSVRVGPVITVTENTCNESLPPTPSIEIR